MPQNPNWATPGVNSTTGFRHNFVLDKMNRLLVTEENILKNSYRAVAVTQTFYSTAAAVLFEMTGSATMTVKIKKILMWGQCATKFFAELTLGRATGQSSSSASL